MVEWRLKCDADGCIAQLVERGHREDERVLLQLGARAHAEGWRIAEDGHRCPLHGGERS
jgi:hypothetical protein